jgi:hypothetical protein
LNIPELFTAMVADVGKTLPEKLPEVITSCAEAVRTNGPFVPVSVTVYLPGTALVE